MSRIVKFIFSLLSLMMVCNQLIAARPIRGFDHKYPVNTANRGKYSCYSGKLVNSFWEYPTNGEDEVIWQTGIVDKSLAGKPVSLRFACGFGVHSGSANHQLFINGKDILTFSPIYGDFTVKNSKASLRFDALYIDENDDIFGIITLTLAPQLIKFGQSQKMRILGSKANSKVWFMLSDFSPMASSKVAKLKIKNKISSRIEAIKRLKQKEAQQRVDALKPQICYFPNNCQAAVSLVKQANSLSAYDGYTKVMVKKSFTSTKFDTTIEHAIKQKQWLVLSYAQLKPELKTSLLNRDRKQLKQFDCLVWSAPVEQVAEYIRMRQQAKVIVEHKKIGHLTVALHGFPSGFKANLPLSVQVLLPDGAWDVRVTTSKKDEIKSKLIVVKDKYGVRFAMKPAHDVVNIFYKK
jgi:hypothetical protein